MYVHMYVVIHHPHAHRTHSKRWLKNDAMIKLRVCANCSSLGAWPSTVSHCKARLARIVP